MRPILDPASQKLWDDWAHRLIQKALDEYTGTVLCDWFAEIIGAMSGQLEAQLRKDMRKEMSNWVKAKNEEFKTEVAKLRKEFAIKNATNVTNLKRTTKG